MGADQTKFQESQPLREQPTNETAVEARPQQAETIPTPEVPVPIEGARDMQGMHIEEKKGITDALEDFTKKLRRPKKKSLQDVQIVRDELTKEVEQIMSDGLVEAFKELSPTEAQAFKIQGEETAREIRSLLKSTRIKVKKIFELIYEWLKMLPGVNSFFLEQEAKIKADKIMALHRKQMSHRSLNITN